MANPKSGKPKGRPKRKAAPTNAELKRQLAAAKRKCTGLERSVNRFRAEKETAESKSTALNKKLAELNIAPNSNSRGANVNRKIFKNGSQNFQFEGVVGCDMRGCTFGYGSKDLAQSRLMEQTLAGSEHKEPKKLKPARRKRPRDTSPHATQPAFSAPSAFSAPIAFSSSSALSATATFSSPSAHQLGGGSESRSKARRVSTRSRSASSKPATSRKRPQRATSHPQNSMSPPDDHGGNIPSHEGGNRRVRYRASNAAEAQLLQVENAMISEGSELQDAATADEIAGEEHKVSELSATEERQFGGALIEDSSEPHRAPAGEDRELSRELSGDFDAEERKVGGEAAENDPKADEESVAERCDAGGDAAGDSREAGGESAAEPCEAGGDAAGESCEVGRESDIEPCEDGGDAAGDSREVGRESAAEPCEAGGDAARESCEVGRESDVEPCEDGGDIAEEDGETGGEFTAEYCDIGRGFVERSREAGGEANAEPCENGGDAAEDGREAGKVIAVGRRDTKENLVEDDRDARDAIVDDNQLEVEATEDHSAFGSVNAAHRGECAARLCKHGELTEKSAGGSREADGATDKDRAPHAVAGGLSAVKLCEGGNRSATERRQIGEEFAAKPREAGVGRSADEDREKRGGECAAEGGQKCEYDQSNEYATIGPKDLDPQYEKDDSEVYLQVARLERDEDTGSVYREFYKYTLCNAEEVDEDGVDEDGEERLPGADQTSAKACRCRIPFKDDLFMQRTYKRCACPTPTFTESGLYGIPGVPPSSKSCLKTDDCHRPRKEVSFADDLVSGPSLPFRKPCSAYSCCADTNSRAYDEQETKKDTQELLIPRWTAISRRADGRHGDIVREHVDHVRVGSRVDLHVGSEAHYTEATVAACDAVTRMVTVRYEAGGGEEKTEMLCIDSPRVWQHDTYTKRTCVSPAACPGGDCYSEGELGERFGEDEDVEDKDVDYDDPPPRTTVTARSWENACHESESDDEDASGSDLDSALVGSGSDAEDENDDDLSPQRAPPRRGNSEEEAAPSPSAPPSSRSLLLSPFPSPKVKSAIFSDEPGDSSGDEEEDKHDSVCAQDGEDDESDWSDMTLSQRPLWE